MIDMLLSKVFGTKNEREVKAMRPIIASINALEPQMQQLSDAELAAKTQEFKQRLADGASLDDLLVEAFAVGSRGRPARAQYAALRCSTHRRHRPASRQDRRNENR